jgi:hypothetical protein
MARFLAPATTGMYRVNFDALDGDMMQVSFAEPVPEPLHTPLGVLRPRSGYGGGAPVSTAHLPTKMRVSGRGARLVDFNTAYHIFLVNRRFIDVVERFQNDVQYVPVECLWNDGSSAGEYFFFFTTVMLDAVIREQTTATWLSIPTRAGGGAWSAESLWGATFAFDKARMGDTHMWVDPNMTTAGALVSEALYAALRDANIEAFQDSPAFAEIQLR